VDVPTQFVPANVNVTIGRNASTPATTGSTPSAAANNTKSIPSVLANGVKNATEQVTEKKSDAEGVDVGRALLLVAASFALLL
jgi:hypothetical protein